MTHEQKPESAEFRTREAQIDGQIEDIFEAHEAEDAERAISKGDLRLMIEAAHRQGEARGAAEQRRKDAEGAEPVAWQYEVNGLGEWQNGEVGYGPDVWRLKCGYIKPDRDDPDYRSLSPLYDHPANVAALEARVKELEGALKEAAYALERVKYGERGGYDARNGKRVSLRMSDGERADIIHSEVTEDCERALVTVRAAIREGGEHG